MNNREIDRLVAEKVMGWEYKDCNGDKILTNKDVSDLRFVEKPDKHMLVKNYSTRIEDTWKVVEMLKDKYWIEINVCNNDYLCDIGEYGKAHSNLQFEAETAPLAICKAALKTVGIEVDE